MADRILEWYIDAPVDDQFSLGPVFIMDLDYQPRVVRVHAKRTPGTNIVFDIRDDGVSIFDSTDLPTIYKGTSLEDVAVDFTVAASTITRYSIVTLHLIDGATGGLSVQLELIADTDDDELDESDT